MNLKLAFRYHEIVQYFGCIFDILENITASGNSRLPSCNMHMEILSIYLNIWIINRVLIRRSNRKSPYGVERYRPGINWNNLPDMGDKKRITNTHIPCAYARTSTRCPPCRFIYNYKIVYANISSYQISLNQCVARAIESFSLSPARHQKLRSWPSVFKVHRLIQEDTWETGTREKMLNAISGMRNWVRIKSAWIGRMFYFLEHKFYLHLDSKWHRRHWLGCVATRTCFAACHENCLSGQCNEYSSLKVIKLWQMEYQVSIRS